jgi:peptide/nickel transport system permease protein
LLAGFFGGKTETILMRIVDVFLAFPLILLALSLAAILGPNLRNLIIVMGLTGWMMYARVIRSAVLTLKNLEFITAAIAVGTPTYRIILRHVLPNIIAPALVLFTFNFAQFIIMESALSFLGLGVPPPTPTWGRMLFDGRDYLTIAWWMITFPGLCIMLTALSLNLVGDGLRDALDPRIRRMA